VGSRFRPNRPQPKRSAQILLRIGSASSWTTRLFVLGRGSRSALTSAYFLASSRVRQRRDGRAEIILGADTRCQQGQCATSRSVVARPCGVGVTGQHAIGSVQTRRAVRAEPRSQVTASIGAIHASARQPTPHLQTRRRRYGDRDVAPFTHTKAGLGVLSASMHSGETRTACPRKQAWRSIPSPCRHMVWTSLMCLWTSSSGRRLSHGDFLSVFVNAGRVSCRDQCSVGARSLGGLRGRCLRPRAAPAWARERPCRGGT